MLAFLLVEMLNCTQKKEQNKEINNEKSVFGQLPDGQMAHLYTLRNANGMEVKISDFGGTIVEWTAPNKEGKYEDITLGCDSLSGYLKGVPYFGAIVGRYGNRIAKGQFVLDGKKYSLAINNKPNTLHGGLKGFDKVLWQVIPNNSEEPSLKLTYLSKDGEEGYPGNLTVVITYTLKSDNALQIDYEANTDKKTVINLTNHAYFNLSGMKTDILGHQLMLNANEFLPTDATLIPTGEKRKVKGTVFDFIKSKQIVTNINDTNDIQIKYGKGYDHCWVLADSTNKLKVAAVLLDSVSGRLLEVLTTEPAIQFYTGNFLDGTNKGKKGVVYQFRSGLCLETQHYPNSPNNMSFPSTDLNPGENFKSTTIYRFSVKK